MNILDPSRYVVMKQSLAGYQQTGIILTMFDGTTINTIPPLDDVGIFVIIPKIAEFFHLNLDLAIYFFFWGIFLVSFLSGLVAIFYLFYSFPARVAACTHLLFFAFLIFNTLSLYSLYSFIIVGILPWLVYLSKNSVDIRKCLFSGLIIGALCSLSHFLRGFAWLPLIPFIILVIARQKNIIKKLAMAFCFLCGSLLPIVYFNSVFERYENFIKKELKAEVTGYKNHAFWHTLYCGLGFLKFCNGQNIKWSDDCAAQKAKELNPNIADSANYESTLMNEILNLVKNSSTFIINTIFGKLGILFFFFLIGTNIGLCAAFLFPKPLDLEFCFCIALCLSSLFPVFSIPVLRYTLSFFSISVYYGIFSLSYWLDSRKLRSYTDINEYVV